MKTFYAGWEYGMPFLDLPGRCTWGEKLWDEDKNDFHWRDEGNLEKYYKLRKKLTEMWTD